MVEEEAWVRPLSPGEVVHEIGQAKHQHQLCCYRLGLCSAEALMEDQITSALSALFRTCPHLRLCIVERGGELWFRNMAQESVDFSISSNTNAAEEIERQVTTSFVSSKGPVWRAVWLPFVEYVEDTEAEAEKNTSLPVEKTDKKTRANSKNSECQEKVAVDGVSRHWLPEVAEQFSHTSTLLLTFHHSITDGFTSLKTCEQLISLLNVTACAGKVPNCSQQIGEFSDGAETIRLVQERNAFLEKQPKLREMIERDIARISQFRSIFTDTFPISPEEQRNRTSSIVRRLSKDQTQKLMKFFREENIRFNSGFIALVNLTLVEMLKKKGVKQRLFEICSFNAINMRRYWNGDSSRALGCHFGPISLVMDTASSSVHQFLEYAHDVQTNMLDYIAQHRALDECLFLDVKRGTNHSNMDEFFASPPLHPQFWYSLTNMGEVSSLLQGLGDKVQLGWISRHNSFHRYNSTFVFAVHTYRKRLYFTMDFNARLLSKNVAEDVIATLTNLMFDIVRQMS
ncbi:uncharacterized protein LOC108678955 [Hyalella azteca]|uniref:Uncharacterized protein LOC108678955 n=1 Tax=Hyalella azteca TaxID=294128 RepID=A0A8B7PA51_HYAAZ|nr:uncharacterized protein LOC108678955 [Hyalella azteca]